MKTHVSMALALLVACAAAQAGTDLAIGDDTVYQRPSSWADNATPGSSRYAHAASRTAVSIAWRNADQIEEVEVKVINLGNDAGSGRLSVDIVDSAGKILLSLTPPDGEEIVQLGAAKDGGALGKIIRMKASWELNGLIDRFDLAHTQYGVMATIEPLGGDDDPTNNRKCKTWNNMSRVTPGGSYVFNYEFVNSETAPIQVEKVIETSHLPPGWNIRDQNAKKTVTLAPGERIAGTLMLAVPESTPQGAFAETRLSLRDKKTGKVYRQHEWFEIFDTSPPLISNYRAIALANHTIAIQALVADPQSGVLEATGVSTQFSMDGGKTWAVKAHNYKTGNFIRPTLFETVIGPFAPGTQVLVRFAARDTAGNISALIPADAAVFVAPAGAEQLLQLAYLFPRTKPNPVFEVEALRALSESIKVASDSGVDVRKLKTAELGQLGLSPARLAELGVDSARFTDLKSDLHKLGMLDVRFDQIRSIPVKHVKAPGEAVLQMNTLELVAQ